MAVIVKSCKPLSRTEREHVFRMYLSGIEAPEIAEKFEKTRQTTNTIISNLKKELNELSYDKIINLVQQQVIRVIDCHHMIMNNLTVNYIETELGIKKSKRRLERFQSETDTGSHVSDNEHSVSGEFNPFLKMERETTSPKHTPKSAKTKVKECLPLIKEIASLEAKLISLGKEITYQNKAFVEMITRIGVPRKRGERDIESHTHASRGTDFGDLDSDLAGLDKKKLEQEVKSSEERQKEYLKEKEEVD